MSLGTQPVWNLELLVSGVVTMEHGTSQQLRMEECPESI